MNSDIKKPGRSSDFPERTGCKLWFFIMYAGTKYKEKLDYAPTQIKKEEKKSLNLDFFQGPPFNGGPLSWISMILTINSPKGWQGTAHDNLWAA